MYSTRTLQAGFIESNISNYKQVIQKVSYGDPVAKRTVAPKSATAASSRHFRRADKNHRKFDNFLRMQDDQEDAEDEPGRPVRLYRRQSSRTKRIVNYFIKNHLEDTKQGSEVYVNSTVNDVDYRTYI